MKRQYVAVIEKDEEPGFGIFFPDFPGAGTAGDTPEEAMEMASELLQFHIDGMFEDGEEIPEPTPLDKIIVDDDLDILTLAYVGAIVPGKTKRVNITIDEALLDEIDKATDNRSKFLAEAAKAALAVHA